MDKPTCNIIAGVNGAGKTTFALEYLPLIQCYNFINADEIMNELISLPINKNSTYLSIQIKASKKLLERIEQLMLKNENFAFETTLSGTAYSKLICRLLKRGWRVNLYYLWIPDVKTSLKRVVERVKSGGHDIPKKDIVRRYSRSVYNFMNLYRSLCSFVICLNNSNPDSEIIFTQDKHGLDISNQKIYNNLLTEVGNDSN